MTEWWNKKWNKSNICGITHTRLRPGKNKNGLPYTITLQCGHGFYINALLEWMKKCPNDIITCPLCRKIINLQNIIDKI